MKYGWLFLGLILFTFSIISKDKEYKFDVSPCDILNSYYDQIDNDSEKSTWYLNSTQSTVSTNKSLLDDSHFLHYQLVIALLKEKLGPEKFQQLIVAMHQKKYGVTHDFLWGNDRVDGLYQTRDFDKVANWIVNAKDLTKNQALAIWQRYCNKRCIGSAKKISGRERIIKEYDNRIELENKRTHKQLQQQQDALLKQQSEVVQVRLAIQKENLQQHMQQFEFDSEQCKYLPQDFEHVKQEYERCDQWCNNMLQHDPSDIWKNRIQAVHATVDQNFNQSWQVINLSVQAQGYLVSQGLSADMYRSCYGTALQQQLHTEVCALFESIAQAQLGTLQKSSFLPMAMQCGDASFWSNQFEVPSLAMSLIDLGSACCKLGTWVIQNGPIYLQAIGEGIVESAWDFVHMVSHPREMIKNIGQAAWFVLDTIVLTDEESIGSQLPIRQKYCKERFDTIHTAVIAMEDYVANSTGPERVKMISKFAADCWFQHKALQAVGAVAGVVRANAGTMRSLEYVANAINHETEFALAVENIVGATEEIEIAVQKLSQSELMELSESLSSQNVSKAAELSLPGIRPFKDVLQDVVKLKHEVPLSNIALCEEVKTVIVENLKKAEVILDQQFQKLYRSKWIVENGQKVRVNMDINHALNYEVIFKRDKAAGILEIEYSGGHLAGSTQRLEQLGLIKIIQKKQLPTGCWEFKIEDAFTKNKFTKTEFHELWTKEMIVEEGWKLFENTKIEEYIVEDNKFAKSIKIGEQELSIAIKKHEKDINLVTLVPYKILKKTII